MIVNFIGLREINYELQNQAYELNKEIWELIELERDLSSSMNMLELRINIKRKIELLRADYQKLLRYSDYLTRILVTYSQSERMILGNINGNNSQIMVPGVVDFRFIRTFLHNINIE